jgi:ABC-type phosphate transport system substrate-binding protein
MKQKRLYSAVIALFFIATAAPCFAHHMAVVVSKQNNVSSMTAAQLGKIFRADTKKWPDGKNIQLVLHRSSAGEMLTLERLNQMSAAQWQSWIADHRDSVKLVDSDGEVLTYVESTPGAVGLVEVHSVNDQVTVVRINGKLPMEDGYLPH